MKKQSLLIYFVLVLFLIGMGFFLSPRFALKPSLEKSSPAQTKTFVVYETIQIDKEMVNYTYQQATSKTTALDVLTHTTDSKIKGEGKNAFVTSINNRVAEDSNHEFWKLIINGKDADVGAGGYIVYPNDKILWKIDHY
jgi:hypothetical protein